VHPDSKKRQRMGARVPEGQFEAVFAGVWLSATYDFAQTDIPVKKVRKHVLFDQKSLVSSVNLTLGERKRRTRRLQSPRAAFVFSACDMSQNTLSDALTPHAETKIL